jgi:V/A-type H+-transporting ATPase subunit K
MYWLIGFMSLIVLALVVTGLVIELSPPLKQGGYRPWYKPTLVTNLALFVGAQLALLFLGGQEVMAAVEGAEAAVGEISTGLGLAIIGIGIPTALSTVGAGIAVGPIGAASLAVLAEKPEIFGRTLIYLGLAEGIAIYGLVMSILLLGRI